MANETDSHAGDAETRRDVTRAEAVKEAKILLKDEANELALLLMSDVGKALTHRARVGIQRELQRFRDIANSLAP